MATDARDLDRSDLELIDFAAGIVERDGDGVVHSVGAAVRDSTGAIHGGINVYHFTGGPCAELVALGAARAAGARDLHTIVAVGDEGRGVLAPCGRDCQVLFDYHPAIRVIVPTADGPLSIPVQELLPFGAGGPDATTRSDPAH
ncbi:MAG: cytidine deaminase family protein [Acidimicrobiales bacterium]